tara:strand:+ start:2731 stop:4182 length:1452 start_codon:yes stop_codon:yes gene_type:complete
MIKRFLYIFSLLVSVQLVAGCSTNPATGENQFTAFMSPAQENQVGAQEHEKVLKEYGLYKNQALQSYVNKIGQQVTKYTERPDVQYKFFLLDSPIVNAFALPGGYIYLTRGVMALSNSEAEMAAVLGHEAGHITARHSAERYSRGVATTLGASILSAVIDSSGVTQALGVGSDLYLKSYSRAQENQADDLGIRYLSRAGYTPTAMTGFLSSLQAESALESKIAGTQSSSANTFFATHPATGERVSKTIEEARQYAQQGLSNRDEYMRMIDGMVYGDSEAQGFVRGQSFFHSAMGFKFTVPNGYQLINQPSQVIAKGANGGAIIFDFAPNAERYSPVMFLNDTWLKGQGGTGTESITINGMKAAATGVQGTANGQAVNLQLVAIQWSATQMARFQIIVPRNATTAQLNGLKSATYSFGKMTQGEKNALKPYQIKIITSKSGDTIASLSRRMAEDDYKEERFRVLNNLNAGDKIVPNRLYKIVVE